MNFDTITIILAWQTTATESLISSYELPVHKAFDCRVFTQPGFVSDPVRDSRNAPQWAHPGADPLFWNFI